MCGIVESPYVHLRGDAGDSRDGCNATVECSVVVDVSRPEVCQMCCRVGRRDEDRVLPLYVYYEVRERRRQQEDVGPEPRRPYLCATAHSNLYDERGKEEADHNRDGDCDDGRPCS